MTVRRLHRGATAAGYTPHQFLINFPKEVPFVSPRPKRNPTRKYFHIFAHEYWHYWHNISTVAGLKQFFVTQHLLAYFSRTLMQNADGTSVGSGVLGADQHISELLHIHQSVEGHCAPDRAWLDDFKLSFTVKDADIVEESIAFGGIRAPVDVAVIAVRVRLADGSERDGSMQFGTAAIEESVAFLLEEHFRERIWEAVEFKTPALPYRLLERVLEYIVGRSVARLTALSIGTLALLMTHPGPALVLMARDLAVLLRTLNEEEAISRLIDATKGARDKVLVRLVEDLSNVRQIHTGRALVEGAASFLLGQYRLAAEFRLQDPLFDLEAVLDDQRPMAALIEFMKTFPSCDVLQERDGDVDVILRDDLVRMSEDPEDEHGFDSSVYTRVFQAQQVYLGAHIDYESGEFLPSSHAKPTRCPEYTACDLDVRRGVPKQCAETPWLVYRPDEQFLCRFGMAVSASLGPVQIRTRAAPATPTHDEIAVAAYFRWLERGGSAAPEGAVDDWLWAERMLLAARGYETR